jgi:hypothetical protein
MGTPATAYAASAAPDTVEVEVVVVIAACHAAPSSTINERYSGLL